MSQATILSPSSSPAPHSHRTFQICADSIPKIHNFSAAEKLGAPFDAIDAEQMPEAIAVNQAMEKMSLIIKIETAIIQTFVPPIIQRAAMNGIHGNRNSLQIENSNQSIGNDRSRALGKASHPLQWCKVEQQSFCFHERGECTRLAFLEFCTLQSLHIVEERF